MNGKYLLLLAGLLTLAACHEDLSDSQLQDPIADPMGNYDGPLAVKISMVGDGQTTRTVTDMSGTETDAFYGKHPFPRTNFATNDAVGIVHVVKRGEDVQIYNFKAVTADGGATWSVQDTEGNVSAVRYYSKHTNYYYAYTPYKEGGLSASDLALDGLDADCVIPTFDEYGMQNGTQTLTELPAYKFFEPYALETLSTINQGDMDGFLACDLLGAKGVCATNTVDKTATLELHLDHMMALDILAMKKWDGKVTVYGTYDTWVTPDKNVWRMKQRMQPVEKQVCPARWPQIDAVPGGTVKKIGPDGIETDEYVPEFEGLGSWYLALNTDTCKFFMKLMKPLTPQKKFGYEHIASEGGWLVDLPPVPAGYYAVLGTSPYFRSFRQKGYSPSESNGAGTLWKEEWRLYFKSMPYSWTYEDILFPRFNVRYDYDEVLEVGDKLLADGNISKTETGVGTVRWIAYAAAPWIANPETYQGWGRYENFFYDRYIDNPTRFKDNGYRPKGIETDSRGVKHLVIDYDGNGCSSLDDFWRTDVCNHFLAFYDNEVSYKASSSEITHNDVIFTTPMPQISYTVEKGLWELNDRDEDKYGYICWSWLFMSDDWQLNKDGVDAIRSTKTAATANGPASAVDGSYWMVPTVAQYYIGHHGDTTDKDYLTCNYLPESPGFANEGVVTVHEKYKMVGRYTAKVAYFGNGYLDRVPLGLDIQFHSYDCMPIACSDITNADADVTAKKDNLYINNREDPAASVIAPPTMYRPCIIF
jgi:hypothetical protein